tara:strand:- start:1339 stop:1446 length:108 start_codon:yes stop_codon:yes gene_type:complete
MLYHKKSFKKKYLYMFMRLIKADIKDLKIIKATKA